MIKIRRSRKIALVSHCILNTNAKIKGTASYPDALQQVVYSVAIIVIIYLVDIWEQKRNTRASQTTVG
ncbi:hypothetical protein [Neomoorella thermoacetica]|uniref:hypothetical protein n=1 Tax=Neomoorella thermoacetica TaxID=1525 RepID=UPI0030D52B18